MKGENLTLQPMMVKSKILEKSYNKSIAIRPCPIRQIILSRTNLLFFTSLIIAIVSSSDHSSKMCHLLLSSERSMESVLIQCVNL